MLVVGIKGIGAVLPHKSVAKSFLAQTISEFFLVHIRSIPTRRAGFIIAGKFSVITEYTIGKNSYAPLLSVSGNGKDRGRSVFRREDRCRRKLHVETRSRSVRRRRRRRATTVAKRMPAGL